MTRSLLTLILVTGCLTAPDSIPPDTSSFTPPPTFTTFWNQTENCSGLTANFTRITWFSASTLTLNNQPVHAYTDWQHHRISITDAVVTALARQDTAADKIIRHELLHDLIQQSGHPTEYFTTRCGAIVAH